MNTSELRRMLIEDFEPALRALGRKLTPNDARARAALVRPIIDTMKLELLHEAMDRPHPRAIPLTEERDATVIGIRR